MNVIVDTCVWSTAIRKGRAEPRVLRLLEELIDSSRVQMLGPIRQELLSGLKSRSQFEKLRDHLRSFPDLALDILDYESASEMFNICRTKGIQGSHIDFLICAVAKRHELAILTVDQDFLGYRKALGIELLDIP